MDVCNECRNDAGGVIKTKDMPGRDYRRAHHSGAVPFASRPTRPIVCMAPFNKAQAAGVSSGSFLELRAQVAKHKESLSKGNATTVVGGKKSSKVRVLLICAFLV